MSAVDATIAGASASLGGLPGAWPAVVDAFRFEEFGAPWALVLLAAPAVALAGFAAGAARRAAVLFASAGLWSRDTTSPTLRARLAWLPSAARAVALALLAVAAARPRNEMGDTRSTTEGVAIQLVIDRSGSMNEGITLGGRSVRRMEAVRDVAKSFVVGDEGLKDDGGTRGAAPAGAARLTGREGDLIGIVAFGTYADTVAPLVREHDALLDLIDEIETATSESEGRTAIGDAVALAAARLRRAEEELERARGVEAAEAPAPDTEDAEGAADTPPSAPGTNAFEIRGKVIILMTDGVSNAGRVDPLDAAALCAEWGIRLYTIGIGGERFVEVLGRRIPQGSNVDERGLRAMAEQTGGKFWLADSVEALREVYAEIDTIEKTEIETSRAVTFDERFAPWAAAGLALLVLESLLRATWLRRSP